MPGAEHLAPLPYILRCAKSLLFAHRYGKLHALNDLVVTPPAHLVQRRIPLLAAGLLSLFCLPAEAFQPPAAVPITRLDERSGIADLDAPHAVSLSIGQPLPVKDALLLLVRGTAFSVVIGDDVDGTFSGELKDLTLRQSIEAVLRPQGLDYTLDGQLISVHRRRPLMRLFDVGYLNVRRDVQRGIRSAGSQAKEPAAVNLASTAGGSYFDEIERGVAALLSPDGRAHVDRRHGVVQVTDFPDRLDRVATYLETVHVRAVRQVRLSARVVEVALADPAASAVDWKAVAQRSGEPWDGTGPAAGVRVRDFSAVLSALAAQGAVRTLASPQVLAMNNEPAVMRVGTQDVYFATAASDRAAAASMTQGFTMTITPQVDASGLVHLSVAPTYAEATGEALRFSEVDTVMRIRDGESILLAGMLQRTGTARTELVILLNATIVTPGPPAPTGSR